MRLILVLFISLKVAEGLSFGVPRRLTTRFGMSKKSKITATESSSSDNQMPTVHEGSTALSNNIGVGQSANNNINIESAPSLGHEEMLDLVYEISLERAGMGSSNTISETNTSEGSFQADRALNDSKDELFPNRETIKKETSSEDENVDGGIANGQIMVEKEKSLGHRDMLNIVYGMSLQRAGLHQNETEFYMA
mmetsp:Transcript_8745/g.12373  ORF Transcript_8745/g.12373 Transcript_8745/m.12373 type:complete len:194 (+) Transcript_8745:133-714(+)